MSNVGVDGEPEVVAMPSMQNAQECLDKVCADERVLDSICLQPWGAGSAPPLQLCKY